MNFRILSQRIHWLSFLVITGDTEETLRLLKAAIDHGAKIVCITSGGSVKDIAQQNKIDLIRIPVGIPARAAIGYSLVMILQVFSLCKLISSNYKKDILSAIELIDKEENNIRRDAKETANVLTGKFPIIYSTAGMESVAIRFRQQLNENAKMLCSHNVFPELDHNELQGWKQCNNDVAVIIFRNETDHLRTSKYISISSEIVSQFDVYLRSIF